MKTYYPALFTPLEQYPDGYCVEFPDLPGCVTQGRNMKESMEMAVDAASGWILTSIEDGEDVPAPSNIRSIKNTDSGVLLQMVTLDIGEYAKKHSSKAIKKTLSIPEWLNTAAEKAGVNFSLILQEALHDRLFGKESNDDASKSGIQQSISNMCGKIEELNTSFSNFVGLQTAAEYQTESYFSMKNSYPELCGTGKVLKMPYLFETDRAAENFMN